MSYPTPSPDSIVAIVRGTGGDRRWFLKHAFDAPHAEPTALTFDAAVVKVRTLADRFEEDGYIETVPGVWYPVPADTADNTAPTAPIWQTSKRARRKQARKLKALA